MRIVVAPDSFKGTLTAAEAAIAIATGLQQALPGAEIIQIPLADGGEGTASVWQAAVGGTWESLPTVDPFGRPRKAAVLWLDATTVVIEAATAIGLPLLAEHERNPWRGSSYGLGELIAQVLPRAQTLWITLGGSATVDGGIGCLQALGATVVDAQGLAVEPGGAGLATVAAVHWPEIRAELHLALDVTNPLLGELGAAQVFAPQKGADPSLVQALELAMQRWANVAGGAPEQPGMGAAGGLGYALRCLGAECHPGIEVILAATQLQQQLLGADWVITGEGCSDRQSSSGKVVSGVIALAQSVGVPALVLSGAVQYREVQALLDLGAVAVWDATPTTSVDLPNEAESCLRWASEQLGRLLAQKHSQSSYRN